MTSGLVITLCTCTLLTTVMNCRSVRDGRSVGKFCRQQSPSKLLRHIRQAGRLSEASYNLHESFGMIEQLRTSLDVPTEFRNARTIRIDGNQTCPSNESILHRHSMQLCPSYFVIEHDDYRLPHTLVQAECRCSTCLHNSSNQTPNFSMECAKIYYYTRVMRVVGCQRGVYRYQQVWERVSVGCNCVQSSVLPSNHNESFYTNTFRTRT